MSATTLCSGDKGITAIWYSPQSTPYAARIVAQRHKDLVDQICPRLEESPKRGSRS